MRVRRYELRGRRERRMIGKDYSLGRRRESLWLPEEKRPLCGTLK